MTNDTGRGQAEAEKSHWTAGRLLAVLTGVTWIATQVVIPTVGLLSRGDLRKSATQESQRYR